MEMEDAFHRLMQLLHLRRWDQPDQSTEAAPQDRIDLHEQKAGPALYAVGDVHGMDNLLADIIAKIEADATQQGRDATIVFLGDVVNRGPQSKQVLERLIRGPRKASDTWIVLRGNHEQMMIDALTRPGKTRFERWLKMGGGATLASYGGSRRDQTPKRALRLIDQRHLEFLQSLPITHVVQDYLFVHAGVEPGLGLELQAPSKLLSIREPFFKKPHGLPLTIIHGHTPTTGFPLMGPGRIGIDTGACSTGILTCIAIGGHGEPHRFLRAVGKRRPPTLDRVQAF